jgi:hypothetical protein
MSRDTPEIAAARIEAERARARLMDTARELQERLSPGALAQNAWEGAKSKGADLAEEAVDAVRRRPAIASGVVAAIALFLAREPLIDMAGKLADGVTSKRKSKKATARKERAGPRKAKAKESDKETDTEKIE